MFISILYSCRMRLTIVMIFFLYVIPLLCCQDILKKGEIVELRICRSFCQTDARTSFGGRFSEPQRRVTVSSTCQYHTASSSRRHDPALRLGALLRPPVQYVTHPDLASVHVQNPTSKPKDPPTASVFAVSDTASTTTTITVRYPLQQSCV